MIEFLTSETGITALGLVAGWFFRYKTERDAQVLNLLARNNQSMNDADARGVRTTWYVGDFFRGALLALIIVIFISITAAGYLDKPVVIETLVDKGWWLWKKTVSEFQTVDGVFFPSEIRKGLLLMMAFYLGQIRQGK